MTAPGETPGPSPFVPLEFANGRFDGRFGEERTLDLIQRLAESSDPDIARARAFESRVFDPASKVVRLDFIQELGWKAVPIEGVLSGHCLEHDDRVSEAIAPYAHEPVLINNLSCPWGQFRKEMLLGGPDAASPVKLLAMPPGTQWLEHAVRGFIGCDILVTTSSESFVLLDANEEHFVAAGPEAFVTSLTGHSVQESLQAWYRFAEGWSEESADCRRAKAYYRMIHQHYTECCGHP